MICLLDTCTFLWLCSRPGGLSSTAKKLIGASEARLLFCDASVLEITLKWSAGKIVLPEPPRLWVAQQSATWDVESLPLSREDMFRASELPNHHRDPFDRLIVAAALRAGATILTPDAAIHRYPVSWRW